ncbi:MAG: helix-turn-helix transcriptional regulator [Candidatus Sericytochromatia bacterium]|nr:helix-turn-helix transcriptional regulator [Candidatus Tanganyikabacteria bacterium]
MLSHEEFRKRLLADPEVQEAYDAQAEGFTLFEQLFEARKRAGLTLEQVAEKMGTKPSAVSRLGSSKHSPSISTLKKYAKAVGHRLEVKLVPEKSEGNESSAPRTKKNAM